MAEPSWPEADAAVVTPAPSTWPASRWFCALCADSRSCVSVACSGLHDATCASSLRHHAHDGVAAHGSAQSRFRGISMVPASRPRRSDTLVHLWDTRSGQRLQEVRRARVEAAECRDRVQPRQPLHARIVRPAAPSISSASASWSRRAAAAAAAAAEPPPAARRAGNPQRLAPPPAAAHCPGALRLAVRRRATAAAAERGRCSPPSADAAQVADADDIQSEWSFARGRDSPARREERRDDLRLRRGYKGPRSWSSPPTGTFFKCRFDPVNGGECTREGRKFSCRRMTSHGPSLRRRTSVGGGRVVGTRELYPSSSTVF